MISTVYGYSLLPHHREFGAHRNLDGRTSKAGVDLTPCDTRGCTQ